jgi:pimeloyl-ACP methyl ester carboxylesterase
VNITSIARRARLRLAIAAAIVAIAALAIPFSQMASARTVASAAPGNGPKPSIVLVHGGWADSGSWDGVAQRLQADGYTVYAPPDPLQGLPYDAAYLADFLHSIAGPIVLVGHSYGGAVITNAANLNVVPFPGAPSGVGDAYIKQSAYAGCMANGLPAKEAQVLAATQRPIATSALSQPSGVPAWQTIPSWAVVGTADHAIPLALQLAMDKTAHAHITEIDAPHLSMVSDPRAVTDVILQAARATS